jgi:putative heme-binding domain-containing protein
MIRSRTGTLVAGLLLSTFSYAQAPKLELRPNDRVCFVGETLAEREVLFGYFEALLQARHPQHHLTFRNLAFSGDTPEWLLKDLSTGESAIRALSFGGIDKYLKEAKADVILMFFGMNDSFAGEKGLDSFSEQLDTLIKAYGKRHWNDASPPRMALVSPIAHEKLGGHFRDPSAHNRDLQRYVARMKDIAAGNGIPFVDLFTPTLRLASDPSGEALTFNGIHLTQYGHWAVAHFLMDGLGMTVAGPDLTLDAGKKAPVDFTRQAKLVKHLAPPPPYGARVHESLQDRLPRLIVKNAPDKFLSVRINGIDWQPVPRKQRPDGTPIVSSPWQEAGEMLRLAIVDRNTEFFYLWRAVNGEYIYGRRKAPFGIINFPGEFEQLRKIVGELDTVVHSHIRHAPIDAAQLVEVKTPTRVKALVRTEKPALNPGDVYKQKQGIINDKEFPTAKTPEEAIKDFVLPPGYEINLFASEREFPLHNPLAMAWDAKGRLWVTTMPSYPHYLPGYPPNDKVLILEDTDGDGKADTHKVFADRLYLPTGIELGNGGVFVGTQPNVTFLKDTTHDDRADQRNVILHGMGTGDSHHAVHTFTWTPEGALLLHEGIFHRTNTETPYGVLRQHDAGIYRFDPDNFKMETLVSYNFANPWGHVYDKWGQNFIADASGGSNYFGLPLTGRIDYPGQHPAMKVFTTVVRPTCGCEIVSSRHFPPEAQGNFLVNNNIGFQGIKQHRIIEEASGFTSKEVEPLLQSKDKNFRPVAISFGPDGALYIVDWYNPLIGHMQFSLRDPGRDHYHGRIWRITYKGRDLVKPAKIDGASIPQLLELLKEYEDRTRYRVRAELRERKASQVKPVLDAWVQALDDKDENHEHHLLEALWVYQGLHILPERLLERLLRAKDYRARAAATRALRNDRDRFPMDKCLDWLADQVNDVHPRVRLEAVIALSYFRDGRAAEITLDALKHPTDYYLNYGIGETLRALEPTWKPIIQSGKPFAAKNPAGIQYLLGNISTQELMKIARSAPVYTALLSRDGVLPQFRVEALEGLAKENKTDFLTELFAAIERIDHGGHGQSDAVMHDLGHLLTGRPRSELAELRPRLEKLAQSARMSMTRQMAYVALMTVDQSLDRVWSEATKNLGTLMDVVEAVALLPDGKLRADSYTRIRPLLDGVPKEFESQLKGAQTVRGRYVRIALPGKGRTLTLAEVEVLSGGQNVARFGKASQSSTAFGGVASRAIDGKRGGLFADGGQTHSKENDTDPWWEVDLLSEQPIDAITVFNRTDEKLGKRLDGFTIAVLDAHRKQVWSKAGNPAPAKSVLFKMQADPQRLLRVAAIGSLVTIPGHEEDAFTALAALVRKGVERDAAVRAVQRIPKAKWPRAEFKPLATALLDVLQKADPKSRGEAAILDVVQLGLDLTGLLGEEGAPLAKEFARFEVQIVRIGTIPHNTAFDVGEFYVQAGKQVVLVLDNTDIMPHNLVIGVPGSLTEIGQLAEKMAQDPNAFALGFVPKTPKVLFATRLLQPRESERLNLVEAPKTPGKYPFICTFPGHWPVMNGIMHVVPDLSKIPVAERVKPLEMKKWTVAMLAADLEHVGAGRSFARGKDLFKLATCIQCHKMGNEGGVVGPELTTLPKRMADKKWSHADLLTEILEPSKIIEPKYKTVRIIMDDGKQLEGLILEEDAKTVKLAKNAVEPPVLLKKESIEERFELKLSMMPEGLLGRLHKEDILDLLAYIAAGGDEKHPAFQRK